MIEPNSNVVALDDINSSILYGIEKDGARLSDSIYATPLRQPKIHANEPIGFSKGDGRRIDIVISSPQRHTRSRRRTNSPRQDFNQRQNLRTYLSPGDEPEYARTNSRPILGQRIGALAELGRSDRELSSPSSIGSSYKYGRDSERVYTFGDQRSLGGDADFIPGDFASRQYHTSGLPLQQKAAPEGQTNGHRANGIALKLTDTNGRLKHTQNNYSDNSPAKNKPKAAQEGSLGQRFDELRSDQLVSVEATQNYRFPNDNLTKSKGSSKILTQELDFNGTLVASNNNKTKSQENPIPRGECPLFAPG